MYKIRNYTANDNWLLTQLANIATMWEAKLHRNCIYPDNIFIWVKDFNGQLYPKIEFDVAGEELQYDMRVNGNALEIGEIHFKSFIKASPYKTIRQDLKPEDAHVTLQAADIIIRH